VPLQVELVTRLSDASAKLADSQMELSAIKQREVELKQHVDKLVTMDTQSRDQLSSLRLQLAGQW